MKIQQLMPILASPLLAAASAFWVDPKYPSAFYARIENKLVPLSDFEESDVRGVSFFFAENNQQVVPTFSVRKGSVVSPRGKVGIHGDGLAYGKKVQAAALKFNTNMQITGRQFYACGEQRWLNRIIKTSNDEFTCFEVSVFLLEVDEDGVAPRNPPDLPELPDTAVSEVVSNLVSGVASNLVSEMMANLVSDLVPTPLRLSDYPMVFFAKVKDRHYYLSGSDFLKDASFRYGRRSDVAIEFTFSNGYAHTNHTKYGGYFGYGYQRPLVGPSVKKAKLTLDRDRCIQGKSFYSFVMRDGNEIRSSVNEWVDQCTEASVCLLPYDRETRAVVRGWNRMLEENP